MNKRKFLALCILLTASAFAAFASPQKSLEPVKYVFLFIGDGMSIPQRMMTDEFLHMKGLGGLAINEFPNNALTYTRSTDSFITDSAASGTAIACGTKTNNGYIGVDAKGNRLESVAEVAKKNGKKVGIITSVTINHATPAAFYAHNDSRGNYYRIALDMIPSGFDFFGGGGIGDADKKEASGYHGDAYTKAREAGYDVFVGTDALSNVKAGCGKTMAFASRGALPYAIDDPDGARIADFTQKAVEILDNPKGFFVMVEGGKIDWMCHANDAATVIKEVLDFDKAVKVALEFQKKHPSETLIVVTGDHETGGLTLGFAGTGYKSYISLLDAQTNSRETIVKKFKKLLSENPEIGYDTVKKEVSKYFGFKFDGDFKKDRMVLTADEQKRISDSFRTNLAPEDPKKQNAEKFVNLLTIILDNKAAVAWTSNAHTALPVSTTAIGAQAEAFNGTIDNTEISKMLKQAVR